MFESCRGQLAAPGPVERHAQPAGETSKVPNARSMLPEEIRRLRGQHPEMRERDFARIQKISEAELVAAFVGEGVVRLRPDVRTFLEGAPSLGEVLALTRNEIG